MTNRPAGIAANLYDDYVKQFTKPWNDYLIKRLLEEHQVLKSSVAKIIVDVGTGSARTLIELATFAQFSDFQLIGLDFYEDMVNQAKENIALEGLAKRVSIMHGDVHALKIPTNSVGIVFGRSVIHHWENPVRAFQEIYRILAPDGVCIIHEPSKEPDQAALKNFNQLRQQFGISGMSLSEKYTAYEVENMLLEAGLCKIAKVNFYP